MWDKTSNFKAYSSIEQMSNYNSMEELARYRSHLIKKSEMQAEFIKSYFPEKIKVIEACSGNSRLLYKLFIEGLIQEAIGVEISASRVNFAQDWKKNFPEANITNVQADILEYDTRKNYYDLAVCITGAFGYFYPINAAFPGKLLEKLNNSLNTQACLMLELYQHVNDINLCEKVENYEINRWVELDKNDPFRFYLSRYIYHQKENCLEAKEIFVRRDGFIDDSKQEILKIYSLDEIKGLLAQAGFEMQDVFSDWDRSVYQEKSEKLIIVARKCN